jgi:hypothetical protein
MSSCNNVWCILLQCLHCRALIDQPASICRLEVRTGIAHQPLTPPGSFGRPAGEVQSIPWTTTRRAFFTPSKPCSCCGLFQMPWLLWYKLLRFWRSARRAEPSSSPLALALLLSATSSNWHLYLRRLLLSTSFDYILCLFASIISPQSYCLYLYLIGRSVPLGLSLISTKSIIFALLLYNGIAHLWQD